MLFSRDEEEPRRIWIDQRMDRKADHFTACDSCDALASLHADPEEVWNPLHLCVPCLGELAIEHWLQESLGLRPYVLPVPDYYMEKPMGPSPPMNTGMGDSSLYLPTRYSDDL